ncbi:MAG: CoA-binding protein [bacterium]|nr:CoA-binding protein [bacterium]
MAVEKVFILGASDKVDRYSHMAFKMLKDHQHNVVPISARISTIDGDPVWKDLPSAFASNGSPDTLTMYVGPDVSSKLKDQIIAASPKRVIFNPGSENEDLAAGLRRVGIEVVEACTLVLLRTGQF